MDWIKIMCNILDHWISLDVTGKEKPRKPCWLSGFRSLLDSFKLQIGGAAGVELLAHAEYFY